MAPRHQVRMALGLLAMLALPVSSYFTGSSVGAYRMFTRLVTYQLELTRVTAAGRVPLPLAELAPHLSLDARRIILPAARSAVGETAAELLASGRADLARLGCALHPEAQRVEVRVTRAAELGARWVERSELRCDGRQALR